MKLSLPIILVALLLGVSVFGIGGVWTLSYVDDHEAVVEERDALKKRVEQSMAELSSVTASYSALQSENQYVRNNTLQSQIKLTHDVYFSSISVYEELLSLTDQSQQSYPALESSYAQIVTQLSNMQYDEAQKSITKLSADIAKTKSDIAAKQAADAAKAAADAAAKAKAAAASVPQSNTAPTSGYNRQSVSVNGTTYMVDVVAGDLSSTRVLVDTASSGDCGNNCPVLPLGEYIKRNSAYAGINGAYFCPASYPSCAGKTNSFDTLLMNKNKTYFNSANNVYSVVPAFIFQGSSVRVVERSLEWGRDTGIDSLIANQPLLVYNGSIEFTGDGDPKKSSKGARSFVANKGNIVYIGVVYNATVAEAAQALQAMSLDNALNLDSGGSSAFWVNGFYKIGPGRDIPNAIIFQRR